MAKRSKAKPKVIPTRLKPGTPYRLGLHDVVRAIKVIEKHGRLAAFVRAAKRNRASARIDAKSVNFVKDFFVEHGMHDDPVGRHIVNARIEPGAETLVSARATAGDPFRQCNFRRRG
jgi:hypothetical protein